MTKRLLSVIVSHMVRASPPEAEAGARLREAAIALFAERGFHATTTRDIAAAAGMSPAAVYVHHRSKEELLHLISLEGHDEVLALVRAAARSADRPRDQVAAIMWSFVAYHARNHTVARVITYELAGLSRRHSTQIRGRRRRIQEEMRRVVARGADDDGFMICDSSITSLALLSMGLDVARWYRDDGRWSVEQVADHYSQLALRMVGVVGAEVCG